MNPVRIAAVVLLLHSFQVKQGPVAGTSIEGVVVDRLTGAAISGITVELTGIVGTNVEIRAAKTDKAGKFLLKNVSSGIPYWLVANPLPQERRYMAAVYGQRGLTGPGVQITLQANQQKSDIRLSLIPTGSISGRILNEKGKPVAGQNVTASRPSYKGGAGALDAMEVRHDAALNGVANRWGTAQTNSRGEYRITGLPPGQYYLSTAGRRLLGRTISGQETVLSGAVNLNDDFEDYNSSTYFPGTSDPMAAAPIDLRAGATADGVDIRIAPVRLRRVRGMVIDEPTGARVPSAQLLLVPRNSPPDSYYTRSIIASKGSFEIHSVLPGSYFLVAFAGDQSRPSTGRVVIEVGRDHLENVVVRVAPGFGFSGRIVFEGREGISSPVLTQARVTLRPKAPSEPGILPEPIRSGVTIDLRSIQTPRVTENVPTRSALAVPAVTATVGSDGRLSFRDVVPWDYTVEVTSPLEDSYVKSVRIGTFDILNQGISMDGPPSGSLEIVIGSDAGSLEGRVVDEKSIPIENIKVILVPAGAPQNRADLFKFAWSNASGTFRMVQIPPGDYTLYAWEQAEDGAWKDPAFLRLYRDRGTPVHIRERTAERVETRLIPPWF